MQLGITMEEAVLVQEELHTIIDKMANAGKSLTVLNQDKDEDEKEESKSRKRKTRSDKGKPRKNKNTDDEEELDLDLDDDDDDDDEDNEDEEEKPKKKSKKNKKQSAISQEDLYAYLTEFVDTHGGKGKKAIKALLKKFGTSKLTELKKKDYAKFLERAQAWSDKQE